MLFRQQSRHATAPNTTTSMTDVSCYRTAIIKTTLVVDERLCIYPTVEGCGVPGPSLMAGMGHVELDSKSPFVRLINQNHRMSNNLCKLSIRRLRCYYPEHSRAVDKLNPSHGPSSEAIAAVPKDQVTMTRDPQSANKQPFYCPRGRNRSNSVRFLTTEHFLRRS